MNFKERYLCFNEYPITLRHAPENPQGKENEML